MSCCQFQLSIASTLRAVTTTRRENHRPLHKDSGYRFSRYRSGWARHSVAGFVCRQCRVTCLIPAANTNSLNRLPAVRRAVASGFIFCCLRVVAASDQTPDLPRRQFNVLIDRRYFVVSYIPASVQRQPRHSSKVLTMFFNVRARLQNVSIFLYWTMRPDFRCCVLSK